ncbi:hypothetical protein OH77DRAFT_1381500, partial [Trametes cingulata]
VLRSTEAVLGGSAALKLFCNGFDDVGDYDIFVPSWAHDEVVWYLSAEEHYAIDDTSVVDNRGRPMYSDPNYLTGISRVTTLRRPSTAVDIIASTDDCATTPLRTSWTTLLMNFVTADGACCAYPSLTAQHRGLFHMGRILDPSYPHDGTPTDVAGMNKYIKRGFSFGGHPT